MIKEAIVKIVNKGDLTYDEAYAVMNEIMSGETTATQNAAFLAALSPSTATVLLHPNPGPPTVLKRSGSISTSARRSASNF